MDRVRPEHTDAKTYREIQETLAWARGDYDEAESLDDLDPDTHLPPPPGTPCEERMMLVCQSLDRTLELARDKTECVRAAVATALA